MPDTTAILGLRSPLATGEGADGPTSFANLAQDVEDAIVEGSGHRSHGKSIIDASQSTSSSTYTELGTPDRVEDIVVPTDGLLFIAFEARWQQSVANAARAAIFIGSDQLRVIDGTDGTSKAEAARIATSTLSRRLVTDARIGLVSLEADGNDTKPHVVGGTIKGTTDYEAGSTGYTDSEAHGGILAVRAEPGTYDISVQFKASSGNVTASLRRLWVWSQAF